MPGAKVFTLMSVLVGTLLSRFWFKKDLSNYQNDNFRTFSNEKSSCLFKKQT